MACACKLIQDTGFKIWEASLGYRKRMQEVNVGNNKLTEVSFPYKRFVLAD